MLCSLSYLACGLSWFGQRCRVTGTVRILGVLGLLLGGLVAARAAPAAAQEAVDYSHTMRLVGTSSAVPSFTLCQADTDWLYTIGSGTLRVVDLSDPLAPAVHGALTGLGTVSDFVVAGDRAYLARGTTGLTAVDLTDRASPAVSGTLALANATAVAMYGTLVAVGGGGTFYLVDATNPSAMSIVGQTATYTVSDLAITGAHALVTSTGGIATIHLEDPGNPWTQSQVFRDDLGDFSESGMYPTFSTIVVDGDRAAVRSAQYVMVWDGWSQYPALANFVVTLDVSNPSAPANLAGQQISADALLLRDDRVIVYGNSQVRAYDTETMAFRGALGNNYASLAAAWPGRYLYTRSAGELSIYDLGWPQTVLPFASWAEGEGPVGCSSRYDLCRSHYQSGSLTTLTYRIYNVTDPLSPVLRYTGTLNDSYGSPDVTLQDSEGDLILLNLTTSSGGGVVVYDLAATPVTSAALSFGAADIDLSGTVAWKVTGSGTLQAVDCSSLPTTQVLSEIAVPEGRLGVEGDYGWLATFWPNTLTMLDLHEPTAPLLGGTVSLPSSAQGYLFRDGYGYLCLSGATLLVLDVSDLESPSIIASVPTAMDCSQISASTDLAVVASPGMDHFQILSLADPAAPEVLSPVVGVVGLEGKPVIRGNRLYVGHAYGMSVYDVGDPANPALVGDASGLAGAVYEGADWMVAPGGAYPLDGSGLSAVEDGDAPPKPAGSASLSVAPNPFNPLTTVRFAITGAHEVNVDVYDLRGALLRRLVAGRWADGEHEVRWDGRDDAGRPLGSGTYLVRLRTDAGAATRTEKVTLVR